MTEKISVTCLQIVTLKILLTVCYVADCYIYGSVICLGYFSISLLKNMRFRRSQNVLFWHEMLKIVSAPDPAGGPCDDSPDPIVARGFLPSAIAASRLRQSQLRAFGTCNIHISTAYSCFTPHGLKSNSVKGRWPMRLGGNCARALGG